MNEDKTDWKLKLRYGQLETPYTYYTVLSDGDVVEPNEEMQSICGPAILGMKVWATDTEEAAAVIKNLGRYLGFEIKGKMEIYETDPLQPPTENPSGYDANITPYE